MQARIVRIEVDGKKESTSALLPSLLSIFEVPFGLLRCVCERRFGEYSGFLQWMPRIAVGSRCVCADLVVRLFDCVRGVPWSKPNPPRMLRLAGGIGISGDINMDIRRGNSASLTAIVLRRSAHSSDVSAHHMSS